MAETSDEVLARLGGPALLQFHRRFGVDTDVAEYISKYKAQVSRGMVSTKAVYLDTNYWVWLRDAEIGKGSSAGVALLSRLRALVAARKIVCVSHLTSMLEIAKQNEKSARASTALVDELTERITLAPTVELDALEIGKYICAKSGATQLDQALQWSCLVLLCHKRRRRFTELQCGQCPRAIARATPSWKRNVVIEFVT